MKDYYYILGLNSNATKDEIKKAYRKLSLKFHPDVNSGDRFFEERFKEILEANEILSDDVKRQQYDSKLFALKNSKKEEPRQTYNQWQEPKEEPRNTYNPPPKEKQAPPKEEKKEEQKYKSSHSSSNQNKSQPPPPSKKKTKRSSVSQFVTTLLITIGICFFYYVFVVMPRKEKAKQFDVEMFLNQQDSIQNTTSTETGGSNSLKEEKTAYDPNAIDANAQVIEITLKALGNTMAEIRYDQTELKATTGSTVKLTLINGAKDSSMQHNFVLIEKDAMQKVTDEAVKAGIAEQFVPNIDEVLIGSHMIMPGYKSTLTFAAPPAGEYKFMCTYPGHYSKMNGKFIVEAKEN
ncbi:MAG: DnaJ domain-containing protein [Bacteroidia bacterium]